MPRSAALHPRRNVRRLSLVVLALHGMIAGCGVTRISLAPLLPKVTQAGPSSGAIAVRTQAEGVPETIGYSTVSLFAIPASPIRFGGADTGRRIMDDLRICLRAAGYEPADVADSGAAPVLSCTIDDIDFSNYTWLSPVVRTWGTIRLTLRLSGPEGVVRWRRQYEEHYSHTGVSASLNQAVNATMSKILARATTDFEGVEFRAASRGVGPSPADAAR